MVDIPIRQDISHTQLLAASLTKWMRAIVKRLGIIGFEPLCISLRALCVCLAQAGKAEGARLLTGGAKPSHCTRGYYVAPTVFADVKPSMRIWREEIFGPVLSVCTFTTEAEAIRLANDSEFGLAGGDNAFQEGTLPDSLCLLACVQESWIQVFWMYGSHAKHWHK